jgi:hypothetical protein
MNPFITFRDKDSNDKLQYYICQRSFPHYIGVISNIPVSEAMCCIPISGYNLYVVFAGTLRGNVVPGYKDIGFEIDKTFNDMAAWYLSERIIKDEKKYKKLKIK